MNIISLKHAIETIAILFKMGLRPSVTIPIMQERAMITIGESRIAIGEMKFTIMFKMIIAIKAIDMEVVGLMLRGDFLLEK